MMQVTGNPIQPTPEPPPGDELREEIDAILSRLDDVRCHPRLPLISVVCACESAPRQVPQDKERAGVYDSDCEESSDESSEDDSEDEDIRLHHVMKSLELYMKQNVGKRKASVLINIIHGYKCKEDIEDNITLQLLDLFESEDEGLQEASICLVAHLCDRESNTFKFVFHDATAKLLDILDRDMPVSVQEAAAVAIQKISAHKVVEELWIEHAMESGLSVLLDRMTPNNSPAVRLAAAKVMAAFASHWNLAMLILDQAMGPIGTLKQLNSQFKEVYLEILTQLVLHTDHTKAEVIDSDVLPPTLHHLRQGPCGPQVQALMFLAALSCTECGLTAVLESNSLGYILSAINDSECRKVRCYATEALSNVFATHKSVFQKQILVQVDKFYHEHEEQLGFGLYGTDIPEGGKFRTDTSTRISRALEDLCSTLIGQLTKAARIEKNRIGQVEQVHLTPTIDVDPITLATIRHLVTTLGHMLHLKVNRAKVKNFNLADLKEAEVKEVWRQTVGSVNPHMAQFLFDSGAICVIDLLHVYTLRLHEDLNKPIPFPPGAAIANLDIHTAIQAWTDVNPKDIQCTSAAPPDKPIFSEMEMELVDALLDIVHRFSQCSCDNDIKNICKEVKTKIEESAEESGCTNKTKPVYCRAGQCKIGDEVAGSDGHFARKDPSSKYVNALVKCKCSCHKTLHDDSILSVGGRLYQDQLRVTLAGLRRQIRMVLYEAGTLESVSPWVIWNDRSIKLKVFGVLSCMIQPLTEKCLPRPPEQQVALDPRTGKARPSSAYIPRDRDKIMDRALQQMSLKTNQVVKEALGLKPPEKSKFEIAKENASETLQSFMNDLDQSRVLNEKQFEDILSKVLESEQEVKKQNINQQKTVSGGSGDASSVSTGVVLNGGKQDDDSQSVPRTGNEPHSAGNEKIHPNIASRPPSAKRNTSRPSSAKSNQSRPGSAKPSVLSSARSNHSNSSSLTNTRTKRPESAKSAHQLPPRPGTRLMQTPCNPPPSARSQSSKSSSLSSGRSVSSMSRCSSARPKTACEDLVRQLERIAPLPWRPSVDPYEPLQPQCQARIVEVCGRDVLTQLFNQDRKVRRDAVLCLEQISRLSKDKIHMKLSECGVIPRLVDFLRINDDEPLLGILAQIRDFDCLTNDGENEESFLTSRLMTVRLLVASDVRLLQLFHRHSGTELLSAMSGYTVGLLRQEVTTTLKQVTRGASKTSVVRSRPGGRNRRVQSAPAGGAVKKAPDVWDNIMMRWREEDNVTLMLRKDVIPEEVE